MGSLIGFFAHNWKLKLAAFALAMLLWITVTSDQVAVRWIPVPVEVEVRDPSFRLIAGPEPDEVLVRFSGPRREFWDLALNRPPLHVVLTEIQPGTSAYALDPQLVRIPRGRAVSALDVSPGSIRLSFQQVASAEVPVVLELEAGPGPERALVGAPIVEPLTITVSGPAERVAGLESVRTLPVDLRGVEGDFRDAVRLDTSGLDGLTLSAGEVAVSGRIERAVSQRFEGVPVQAPPGVLVVPGAIDLEISGAESVVRGLVTNALRVVVPQESIPTRIPNAGVSVPVRLEQLPVGASAVAEPRQVQVLAAPAPPAAPEIRPLPATPAPDTVLPIAPDTVPANPAGETP